MSMKESFLLHLDYEDCIEEMTDEEAGQLLKALFQHENPNRDEPKLAKGAVSMAYSFISKQLDREREAYELKCEKLRANASKSKQMKADESRCKQKGYDKDKDKDKDKDIKRKNIKKEKNICFVPPAIEEVRAYCDERNNGIDAIAFISFYESKGWMIGKNKMKDWKAAVRTWERSRVQKKQEEVDNITRNNQLIDEFFGED